jgi:hypothetical protein
LNKSAAWFVSSRAGFAGCLRSARRQLAIILTTLLETLIMSKNRGVVYTKPGEVQVQDIADPKFEDPRGRKIEHGVILKVVSTNICGSDQHMVRGRTTAPAGMVVCTENLSSGVVMVKPAKDGV